MISPECSTICQDNILRSTIIIASKDQDALPRCMNHQASETLRAITDNHATIQESSHKLCKTDRFVAHDNGTDIENNSMSYEKAKNSELGNSIIFQSNDTSEDSYRISDIINNDLTKEHNKVGMSDTTDKINKLNIISTHKQSVKINSGESQWLDKNMKMEGSNDYKKCELMEEILAIDINDKSDIRDMLQKNDIMLDDNKSKMKKSNKTIIECTHGMSENIESNKKMNDLCSKTNTNTDQKSDNEILKDNIRISYNLNREISQNDSGAEAEDTSDINEIEKNISGQKCKNGTHNAYVRNESGNRNTALIKENVLDMIECSIKNEDDQQTKIGIKMDKVKRDANSFFINEESRKYKRSISLGDISSPPGDTSKLANRRLSGIGDLSSFPKEPSFLVNRRLSGTGDHKIRAIRVKHSNTSRIQMERRKSLREVEKRNMNALDAEKKSENITLTGPSSNTPKISVDSPEEPKPEKMTGLASTSTKHFVNRKTHSYTTYHDRRKSTGGDLDERQKSNQHFKRRNSDNMLMKTENEDGHVKVVLLPPCPTSEPPPLPQLEKNFCMLARPLSKNEQFSTTESDSDHSPTRKQNKIKSRRKCLLAPIPKPPSFRRVSCDWSLMLNKVDGLSINEETTEDREESDFTKHSKFVKDESDKV